MMMMMVEAWALALAKAQGRSRVCFGAWISNTMACQTLLSFCTTCKCTVCVLMWLGYATWVSCARVGGGLDPAPGRFGSSLAHTGVRAAHRRSTKTGVVTSQPTTPCHTMSLNVHSAPNTSALTACLVGVRLWREHVEHGWHTTVYETYCYEL